MSLVYIEDYLDTFEQLPNELTRQLTLLKELGIFSLRLDAKSNSVTVECRRKTGELLTSLDSLSKQEKREKLLDIASGYEELHEAARDKIEHSLRIYRLVDECILVILFNSSA